MLMTTAAVLSIVASLFVIASVIIEAWRKRRDR